MESRKAGLFVTGAAGGGFAGLTGVGGGALLIPLMTGVLKMRQHTAHGTSLVIIIFAAAASAVAYQVDGAIDWNLVGLLLVGSMAGAYVGARLVQYLPAMRLRQVLGLFQICVALRLLLIHTTDPLLDVSGVLEAVAGAGIGFTGG
ncbi:MAG TPA: sulfite exporter TauE/SafE family protein, partial [Tepidiformaceae bacterium]|nr:sulfite exporter TauE/SafE family protein [Tepidiformaceae bacterium]